ncbi:MAG: nei [Acidimicrobiales bacterium]|nr:nei [Acidimicrobiales bacterium]
MPEGDTIHRTAARLRPALVGRDLVRFEAPRLVGDRPRPGARIEAVEARGKHLLIDFAGGLTLQTHLRMTGSWHLYRTGERWQKPAHLVRALDEVDGWIAVCFAAPVVRTYRRDAPGGALGTDLDPVGHLGPDLCGADPDVAECVRRLRDLLGPDVEAGVALLDQRVACGVGNVYKSEVLHQCRVDPFVAAGRLDDATWQTLLETAARLLRANLVTSRRTTVSGPPGSVAVYGRQRQPCPRCGTPIRMRRQGEQARSTYWCPTCQPGPQAGRSIVPGAPAP